MINRELIANDILAHLNKKNKIYWTTSYEIKKHVKSSTPEFEYYNNPWIIGRGIMHLLKIGKLKRVSNRKLIKKWKIKKK